LGAAAVSVLENVARLGRLPTRGLALVALPMKIDGGTGGPAWEPLPGSVALICTLIDTSASTSPVSPA
jgi:hypothetical protein